MTSLVENWTNKQVAEWLRTNGFVSYEQLLCDTHNIDGTVLLSLSETDLRSPPLSMQVLGDIKRLAMCIKRLQLENIESMTRLGLSVESLSITTSHNVCSSGNATVYDVLGEGSSLRHRIHKDSDDSSTSDDPSQQTSVQHDNLRVYVADNLEPELWKTAISIFYFFLVTWITAIVMVIVHDRVPDMEKYPPLPDIFLENIPYIPWAFDMCEVAVCILGFIWAAILTFHKHRSILLRRMFSIFGSVFLLRCITMLITSLSVPGRHLDCKARPYSDLWVKLSEAFTIWRGAGLSIRGVRTCGDYMFSGHTVTLTMFNFFITEYTPRGMYYLHTFSWVLNVFGIFFILAAHEHYSIDVFIAFYISTRLFLYYHTLANNRDLMQRDSKRTRIWFPLFSFFESQVGGIVPSEWENLFSFRNLRRCVNTIKVTVSFIIRNTSNHR